MKPQKSTFNSYNLFFYRFVVIFNIKYHFLKIFHKKASFFDAIIGTRMDVKLGRGFYLIIEDGYQDNDRCHAVNPRWPTPIPTLFSARVNKKRHITIQKGPFFTMSSKVRPFVRNVSVNINS